MLATLSLVIRHEALARRGETIYYKSSRIDLQVEFGQKQTIIVVDPDK